MTSLLTNDGDERGLTNKGQSGTTVTFCCSYWFWLTLVYTSSHTVSSPVQELFQT